MNTRDEGPQTPKGKIIDGATRAQVCWLAVSELQVDPSYQHPVEPRAVEAILAHWPGEPGSGADEAAR